MLISVLNLHRTLIMTYQMMKLMNTF